MKTITLEQFHEILNNAYAVDVNDTLYFLGHDDDGPYVADNKFLNVESFSLAEVDGDIEVLEYGFFFYVAGEAMTLKLLGLLSQIA
jgi:hypothetical protein